MIKIRNFCMPNFVRYYCWCVHSSVYIIYTVKLPVFVWTSRYNHNKCLNNCILIYTLCISGLHSSDKYISRNDSRIVKATVRLQFILILNLNFFITQKYKRELEEIIRFDSHKPTETVQKMFTNQQIMPELNKLE